MLNDSDAPTAIHGAATPAGAGSRDPSGRRPTPRLSAFEPGDVLAGRYRILGLLGRGGMGDVYRADDLTLGQPVALKFLPPSIEVDPSRLDRFLNEIRSARQVAHPNVCRVYDVGEADGRHFLSMEYVDGEDLASLLRRIGRLPPDKALEIARQICAGLAASHDRGVLHRDLKPANVMLDGRGKVRITDFGLASPVDAKPDTSEIAGTPAYMAPEQLAGETLSIQTDLYALGLLLFEIFTGQRFHQAASLAELRELHQRPPSAALATASVGLDPVVEPIIERCLERDPRKRPASAMAVAAALPGGDPLAAALAAGETPSPQMVAASGEEGGLPIQVAVACLLAVLIGSVAYAAFRRPFTIARFITLEHSTDVLATKAQEMLARIGYPDRPGDTVSGLVSYREPIQWIEEHDQSVDRWTRLSTMNPPAVAFWHRTSPRPIFPFRGSFGGLGPSATDPPFTLSGMTYLEIDTQGRLIVLEILAPQVERAEAPAAAAPDWSRLFVEAGLDQAAFTPVAPTWVSAGYADARAAWTGPSGFDPAVQLSVQAASYRGRPVFFRVVAPWTRPERLRVSATNTSTMIFVSVELILFTAIATTAIILARRNLRLARGDRRGAWRFAFVLGVCFLAQTLLRSHHVAQVEEVGMVLSAVSVSLLGASLIWLMYIALEPYVRRRWPQSLISWTRLLSGRWRDPLVGRDLLLGGVVSVLLNLLNIASPLLNAWIGQPMAAPSQPIWSGLTGIAAALSHFVEAAVLSSFAALMFLFVIFMLRVLLRHELAAAAAFVVVNAGLDIAGANGQTLAITIPVAVVFSATLFFLLTRLGLLAFVSGMFLAAMSDRFAFWLDFGPSYDRMWILALIVTVTPAAFGFYTSIRGRPWAIGDRQLME